MYTHEHTQTHAHSLSRSTTGTLALTHINTYIHPRNSLTLHCVNLFSLAHAHSLSHPHVRAPKYALNEQNQAATHGTSERERARTQVVCNSNACGTKSSHLAAELVMNTFRAQAMDANTSPDWVYLVHTNTYFEKTCACVLVCLCVFICVYSLV